MNAQDIVDIISECLIEAQDNQLLGIRNAAEKIHAAIQLPHNPGAVEGKTQKARLALVLSNYRPHSTFELVRKVYGINTSTVARLASRVDDLRHEGWGIRAMKSKKQPNKWWYCATVNSAPGVSALDAESIVDELMQSYDAAAAEYE